MGAAAGSGGDSLKPGVFLVARNPRSTSSFPYVLRVPVEGEGPLFLATKGVWPGPHDLFCYPLADWPEGADVLESVEVEHCWRSGAAVHLVLKRRRARRSLFIWTRKDGRTLIFWRSRTSMRGARPGIRVPQARGLERSLRIAIDIREQRPWQFRRYSVETERRELPVGDYAVLRGAECLAAVERKSVADLATSCTGGELALTLSELGQLPYGALVVEGRLSDVIKEGDRRGVKTGWLLNLIAALQVAHPRVSWVFAETRALAEDFAYRWLAACSKAAGDPGDSSSGMGTQLRDASARRQIALQEAAQGTVWTTAALAERFGVTKATAWRDLKSLVERGLLVAEGPPGRRQYRISTVDRSSGA